MALRDQQARPSSKWWLAVSIVVWILACASLLAAVIYQKAATKPTGEGTVFVDDTKEAGAIIADAATPTDGVRRARNHLKVEAVSLVSPTGEVTVSTSRTLMGLHLTNPLLQFGVSEKRMAALAAETETPIELDGVVEWPAGSVLYHVVAPLTQNDFVIVHYDIAELLARRARPGDIQVFTIELVALGGIFAVLGAVVLMGHSRAVRRDHEMLRESELLRTHSLELEETNHELAEARRKAERALALAEEKMRIRSDFVLMINHELRTPLTSVVTGAELLRDESIGPDEREEIIDSMVTYGKRLYDMIDQILTVARIENRGFYSELTMVPLKEVCSAAHIDHIDGVVDPELISVHTDVRTLNLVLGSLADNARTHGASHVTIRVSSEPLIEPMLELGERPETSAFICVVDDGPGIDPEFLPRAFEKFEKDSFSSGTGLGLYIVRLIVEALSGAIAVQTSPQGTTFQIALPAQVDARIEERV